MGWDLGMATYAQIVRPYSNQPSKNCGLARSTLSRLFTVHCLLHFKRSIAQQMQQNKIEVA